MRTVKSLIEELKKFPDDAQCFAYEGEVSGLVITHFASHYRICRTSAVSVDIFMRYITVCEN